jgi:peptidoglycan/LPS O-acetylase OafA/YrhL
MNPQTSRRITIALVLATIAGLITWDVIAAVSPGDGDTISEVTLAFARRHPSVGFLIGGLLGHLFWPRKDPPPRSLTIPALALVSAAWIACDMFQIVDLPRPAIALLIGIPVGHLLWGQRA